MKNGYDIINNDYYYGFTFNDFDFEIERVMHKCNDEKVLDSFEVRLKSSDLDLEKVFTENKEAYEFVKEASEELRWGDLIDTICLEIPKHMSCEVAKKVVWAYERKLKMEEGEYKAESDVLPYYLKQKELAKQVVDTNERDFNSIQYIAGVDVAYKEDKNSVVAAVSVLDFNTLEIVEQVWHQESISFPYVPGMFSFREVPPILEAFKKLKIQPELVVCDAHGKAHPLGIGMASHLGVTFDIPTIGCAKTKFIGQYNEAALGNKRGDSKPLKWANKIVGSVLVTQDNVKPMFVSVGHQIDLETAKEIVLKLCPNYRLPETTRAADHLVNKMIKEVI